MAKPKKSTKMTVPNEGKSALKAGAPLAAGRPINDDYKDRITVVKK